MIKYLYVLASDETDYYLAQALLSITSLKMHTPNAFVSLLIDDTTEKTLKNERANILNFINELVVVNIDQYFNKKARSRWLKTSMRNHISGDFLFIDCDTVICDDLNEIESENVILGAVLDGHFPLNVKPEAKKLIQNTGKLLGFSASFTSDNFFNSGVILCQDIPESHTFFDKWHKLWITGILQSNILFDQASFNEANLNGAIAEMNGIWNCQISISGGIIFLANAKIIHYFASHVCKKNPYKLADSDILRKIKDAYIIDEELKNCLLYPKQAFALDTRLEVRRVRELIYDAFLYYIQKLKSRTLRFF